MGDHLALLVDRLLTESTLEATIENQKQTRNLANSASSVVPIARFTRSSEGGKLMECRICQEEDEATNMETPCSCCGSLKYAHRKCVQMWCNAKGDTSCEICLQQFKPSYSAPPPLFHYGSTPMNFRGSWEISSRDLHDSQIITMFPSDRGFTDSSSYGLLSSSTTQSTMCCRSVAIIFTIVLVLRHSLPLIIGETEEYSIALFSLFMLRTVGLLIALAVMVKTLILFQRRRQRQEARDVPISGSDEESLRSHSVSQPHPRLIRVR